jgi:large subunit ribosomal protein L33
MAKSARVIITLECTEARGLGKPPSRYTTTKNKRNTPGRLEKKKYNPFLRRHTVHKEIK